ncbi:hypothetical protein FHS16_004030 [Paenibacillus endophyticus]|uniref:NEAT domain-containing protein n=1 Tax=Paenibacillus endophyticus TaxID=1294268 RepID=A0A7W5GB34_9BACL|nr:hypothetical protein [Paenibacillus endophyticus]MBB3153954.1 hypothetical protein [Paenibacillus endophyticus]
MMKSMKKLVPMMLLTLVFALVMAIPAFAASQSYRFLDSAGSATSFTATHSSAFINGAADVTGSTATITLTGDYFPSLKVNGVFATRAVVGGNTTFTFPVADVVTNIPVELRVYIEDIHDATFNLQIDWL